MADAPHNQRTARLTAAARFMTIYLHSILAGPSGVRHPGKHDVPDHEGQALIDAGYAEPYTESPSDGSETAAMPTRESAMLPRPRPATSKPKVTPPPEK